MNKEIPKSHMEVFLETKEYQRFAEFCDACHRYRYIGLCYGLPGVGKTLSARHYAQWNLIEVHRSDGITATPPPEAIPLRTVFYTPSISNSPDRIAREVAGLRLNLLIVTEAAANLQQGIDNWDLPDPIPNRMELLIVDEADRLKMPGLEQVRDLYDRSPMGLVLIGMPGIEKRLARFPQLYSRVGFVHEFRSLNSEESRLFLEQQWKNWGFTLNPGSVTEADATAAIIRITNGNFRLLHRLLAQIERIADINALRVVSKEVVEIARQQLVIGSG